MIRWMVALLVLTALAPSLLAAQAQPDATEREVLALHREINEAMFRRDPEPLTRAALENLVVVTPGGYVETKAQVIRGTQNFRMDSVGYRDREVRVQGSTAVVTGKLMLSGELRGIDPATGQRAVRVSRTGQPLRQMSVFVKEQGRWWLLAQTTVPIRMPEAASRRTVDQTQADAAALESVAVEPRPRVIAADEGVSSVGENGFITWIKVGSISTGASQLYVGSGIVPPGTETPAHLHEIDEEVLYVLEGEITLTLGDVVHTVGAGGTAFIPPGTWMKVENRSDAPARVLGILPRGDVERCFRAIYPSEGYYETPSDRQRDFAFCKTQLHDQPHSEE